MIHSHSMLEDHVLKIENPSLIMWLDKSLGWHRFACKVASDIPVHSFNSSDLFVCFLFFGGSLLPQVVFSFSLLRQSEGGEGDRVRETHKRRV